MVSIRRLFFFSKYLDSQVSYCQCSPLTTNQSKYDTVPVMYRRIQIHVRWHNIVQSQHLPQQSKICYCNNAHAWTGCFHVLHIYHFSCTQCLVTRHQIVQFIQLKMFVFICEYSEKFYYCFDSFIHCFDKCGFVQQLYQCNWDKL